MMFGAWGNPDHDDSIRIIHAALDAGINFIDTADVYSRGESEEIVGKALQRPARRRRAGHQVPRPDGRRPEPAGQLAALDHPEVEDSLRRLGTDWIDLYQVHRPDPDTDIDETLGALTDLVRAGQGPLRRLARRSRRRPIVEAQWAAERRGRERFVCEQPPYSMLVRGIEARRAARPAQRYGMGVIPWSPLGRRLAVAAATGRAPTSRELARRAASRRASTCRLPENQRKLDVADALAQLADEAGHHAVHLALAFVLNHPAVTSAIIGPRTMEQLESQLGAADVVLADDVLDRIDEIVPPGRTSTRPTPGTRRRRWPTRPCAAGGRKLDTF